MSVVILLMWTVLRSNVNVLNNSKYTFASNILTLIDSVTYFSSTIISFWAGSTLISINFVITLYPWKTWTWKTFIDISIAKNTRISRIARARKSGYFILTCAIKTRRRYAFVDIKFAKSSIVTRVTQASEFPRTIKILIIRLASSTIFTRTLLYYDRRVKNSKRSTLIVDFKYKRSWIICVWCPCE